LEQIEGCWTPEPAIPIGGEQLLEGEVEQKVPSRIPVKREHVSGLENGDLMEQIIATLALYCAVDNWVPKRFACNRFAKVDLQVRALFEHH